MFTLSKIKIIFVVWLSCMTFCYKIKQISKSQRAKKAMTDGWWIFQLLVG